MRANVHSQYGRERGVSKQSDRSGSPGGGIELEQAPKVQLRALTSAWQGFGVAMQNSTGAAKALAQAANRMVRTPRIHANENRDPRRLNLCNAGFVTSLFSLHS